MSIIKNIKKALGYSATNKLIGKEAEYKLYEMVSDEIASGEKDIGVWTKAYSMADGNEQVAKAKYIELMVQRYKDSIEAGQEMEEIFKEEESNNKSSEPKEMKDKTPSPDSVNDGPLITLLVVITVAIFLLTIAFLIGNSQGIY